MERKAVSRVEGEKLHMKATQQALSDFNSVPVRLGGA
jgi:hypothetical protein